MMLLFYVFNMIVIFIEIKVRYAVENVDVNHATSAKTTSYTISKQE